MLTQSFTHKSHKITTLKTTDSYKQLFVLITMLLTVLSSVQPLTFAMAAPMEQTQHHQLAQSLVQQQQQQQQHISYQTPRHKQLQEILSTERKHYQYDHQRNYINHNHHHLQQLQPQLKQQQQQQHQHHYQQPQPQPQPQHEQLKTDLKVIGEGDEEERLHKRAISWHDYYNSIMQSHAINWYNPCGGISKMDEKPVKRRKHPPIKKELRKLQNTIAKNYNLNKDTLHAINIRNMKQWDLTDKYSFLPKLNINSSISLRRWHRQLQVYVAAFEYLRRAQLHFDYVRDSQESAFAHELNELMKDARNILCNIEHAINNTTTRKSASTIDSLFISRTKMEDILKFTTDIRHVSPLKWHLMKTDDKSCIVNVLDLRFTKSLYYNFVRKLMNILRIHTKRPGPIYLGKRGGNGNKITEQQLLKPKQRKNKIRHSG